ncbi:cytochrome b5 reductase 4 isoform X2 [Amblyraja radiata]|uniref:cytochrome b5 reductase 4 isoform X2 n=1 Tax=Amblyraja radiata TaxID=386614 RepID=UPI001403846E|nr:cytochrome b5 reductase 4 isoform X2 [Amblyraja radiata]
MDGPSQFPAVGSQQRAAAPRTRGGWTRKMLLKPGRSLMDWIRLIKSGKDMTGLRGKLLRVTPEELAKHKEKTDCWICIRGMVYNVTPYLEYHPGGEDELMRGAGADATELFDQIHSWVNYDSILKECLVGRMTSKPFPVAKASVTQPGLTVPKWTLPKVPVTQPGLTVPKEMIPNGLAVPGGSQKQPQDISPRYEWFQTEDTITVVIYTKQKDTNSDSVIVDLEGDVLRTEVRQQEYSYILQLELSHEVQEVVSVLCSSKVGKIELYLKKLNNTVWSDLGQPGEDHDSYKKNTNGDVEVVRPYTPVLPSLCPESVDEDQTCTNIYLMVKIYPDGLLTPIIDKLQIGDSVSMSSPEGNFFCTQLEGITELILMAAGTGFTPMVKLIIFALKILNFRKIRLVVINKEEKDILWKDQLDKLASTDQRFEVDYILSQPHAEWAGRLGRIEMSLCAELLSQRTEGVKSLVCVCGPASFAEIVVGFYKELGVSDEEICTFSV